MNRVVTLIAILPLTAPIVGFAADGEHYEADPEMVLRLIRNDKLELILPER
jgi:hypothetical protein